MTRQSLRPGHEVVAFDRHGDVAAARAAEHTAVSAAGEPGAGETGDP